ncbi:hypothetical protein AG1IA_10418 [Rhizoctonia solani AG-1 IA]|uniref:Uncharacterized protein n=1 Tax=Thanatephorus cucumeris (strain AG1-IA) TaxID=983506 RepID=L8WFQ5_THACA|nr:hypothetical protein AG1IA_10418 [Rhizoctonia solani AG-1 IA]
MTGRFSQSHSVQATKTSSLPAQATKQSEYGTPAHFRTDYTRSNLTGTKCFSSPGPQPRPPSSHPPRPIAESTSGTSRA